ncbi:hypothetical protein [Cereibacter changlensis]|uniref:hypothetical protein n=1 Tax=Cereibacter changlensis TaxID=402884 RepID=UPI00403337E5
MAKKLAASVMLAPRWIAQLIAVCFRVWGVGQRRLDRDISPSRLDVRHARAAPLNGQSAAGCLPAPRIGEDLAGQLRPGAPLLRRPLARSAAVDHAGLKVDPAAHGAGAAEPQVQDRFLPGAGVERDQDEIERCDAALGRERRG